MDADARAARGRPPAWAAAPLAALLGLAILWPLHGGLWRGKSPWRPNADELLILGPARGWTEGSGLAGLLQVARAGVEVEGHFRPAAPVLWALLRRGFGEDARVFLAVSLGLHLLAAALVALLAREVLGDDDAFAAPLVAGVWFAAHPLPADTIYWLACQQDLLHAPLYLGSLLLFLRARRARRGAGLYAASVLLAALAGAAKEFVATLPLVLLAWTAIDARSPRELLRALPRLAPYFALAPLPLLARWAVLREQAAPGATVWAPPGAELDRYLALLWAHAAGGIEDGSAVLRNLFLWLPDRVLGWGGSGAVLAATLLLGGAALARSRDWGTPAKAAALAWLYLLPVLNELSHPARAVEGVASRWAYVPTAAGALFLAWALGALGGAKRPERPPV